MNVMKFPFLVTAFILILPVAMVLMPGGYSENRRPRADFTIISVDVDPEIIGYGVLNYPDTYDREEYENQQTTMDFSDDVPNEGQTVMINLTVFNIGLSSGEGDVYFYDGPMENGTFIGSDRVNITPLSYDIARVDWDTSGVIEEEHEIFAYIIPEDAENETDPSNNQGSESILINFYPIANIEGYSATNSTVLEGDEIIFSSAGSWDTQRDINAGLVYRWYFYDPLVNGSAPLVISAVNLTDPSYSFEDSGEFDVALEIVDQHGASASDMISIIIENRVPQPSIEILTEDILEDTEVKFRATVFDSKHDISSMNYSWDFGDGSDTYWDPSPETSHTYSVSGTYKVTLRSKDDEGEEGEDSMEIRVSNPAPVALIKWALIDGRLIEIRDGTLEVEEDQEITLFANGTYDNPSDMDELIYTWTLPGDNRFSGDALDIKFQQSGRKGITLTATDDDGQYSHHRLEIVVNNVIPIANAGGDMEIFTNLAVFNGSGSLDTESDIETLRYLWDFGDGTGGEGKEVQHLYDEKGIHLVRLTVTDDDGGISSDTLRVNIRNLAPVIEIQGPDSVVEDQVFNLSAANSFDPDGDIIEISWLIGPGRVKSGSVITHAFHRSGIKEIKVQVLDDNDAVSRMSLFMEVINEAPEADAGRDLEVAAGDIFSLISHNSTDTPSDLRNLTYEWILPKNRSVKGRSVDASFTEIGNHTVLLRVTDDDGLFDIDRITVWVQGAMLSRIEVDFHLEPGKCDPGEFISLEGSVNYVFPAGISPLDADLARIVILLDGEMLISVRNDNQGNFRAEFRAPKEEGKYEISVSVTRMGVVQLATRHLIVEKPEEKGLIAFAGSPMGITTGVVIVFIGAGSGALFGTEIGRWKFFTLLIPLFSRIRNDEVLNNFERGRIYQYIVMNPGEHFSRIKKMLDLNTGTLTYHLKVLEQRNYIKSRSVGMYKRFYPYDMKVETGPHRDIQELILQKLAYNPGMSQRELAEDLGIHVSTVNYHVNIMVGAGILRSSRSGSVNRYEIHYTSEPVASGL